MVEYVMTRSYTPGTYVRKLVNAILGIVEAAFALRLLLELLGASTSSQFVATVYTITDKLLGPFAGAFPDYYIGGGFSIDVTTIVAMIGYAIFAWVIIRILTFIFEATNMT